MYIDWIDEPQERERKEDIEREMKVKLIRDQDWYLPLILVQNDLWLCYYRCDNAWLTEFLRAVTMTSNNKYSEDPDNVYVLFWAWKKAENAKVYDMYIDQCDRLLQIND